MKEKESFYMDLRRGDQIKQNQSSFIRFFESFQDSNSHFDISLSHLKSLENEVSSDEDLMYCLLEDSIYSSLQATYLEEMYLSIRNNPDIAGDLIHGFLEKKEARDILIANQTDLHLKYVTKFGHCSGCDQCENHADVDELIGPYQEGDLEFFMQVFLGMHSIFRALEDYFYNHLPHHPEVIEEITREEIFKFRQFIFNYASENFSKLFI